MFKGEILCLHHKDVFGLSGCEKLDLGGTSYGKL